MLLQTKFYCFLLHRHHQKKYVSFHNVMKFLSIQVWNIFGAKTLWVFTRFLLFLQQDENWRNTYDFRKKARSYHRNNENARSKNISLLSSMYVTTRRMCTMGSNHFWRQNTMRFHEIITKYSFCKWWKLKNILWKRKCTEIINAPSNKILPLSSTPYHQTKYIPK